MLLRDKLEKNGRKCFVYRICLWRPVPKSVSVFKYIDLQLHSCDFTAQQCWIMPGEALRNNYCSVLVRSTQLLLRLSGAFPSCPGLPWERRNVFLFIVLNPKTFPSEHSHSTRVNMRGESEADEQMCENGLLKGPQRSIGC